MADNSGARSDPPRLPFHKQLWAIRETLIIILVPIILAPIPIAIPGRVSRLIVLNILVVHDFSFGHSPVNAGGVMAGLNNA